MVLDTDADILDLVQRWQDEGFIGLAPYPAGSESYVIGILCEKLRVASQSPKFTHEIISTTSTPPLVIARVNSGNCTRLVRALRIAVALELGCPFRDVEIREVTP